MDTGAATKIRIHKKLELEYWQTPVNSVRRKAFVKALPTELGSVTIGLSDSVHMECPLSLGVEHIAD